MRSAALLALLLFAAGCGGVPTKTPGDKEIATRLVGRWEGAPVHPPERTWLENGRWDVWFSPDGDFSAVVDYTAGTRYELHFEGKFRVFFGSLYIDGTNLAGAWQVVPTDENHVVLKQREVAVVLARRFGT